MTYLTARAQLVTMIEGLAPGITDRAFGAAFRHHKHAMLEEGAVPPSRGFWLQQAEGATNARDPAAVSRRSFHGLDLSVFYREQHDRSRLDEVIGMDYEALADRLLDQTQWNRPTSGIIEVTRDDREILPFEVEDVDGGGRLLTIRVDLHHD